MSLASLPYIILLGDFNMLYYCLRHFSLGSSWNGAPLIKSVELAPLIKSHLVMLEKQLCDSHLDEKCFEGNTAVTKIKEDPNYFFRYAKKRPGSPYW